MKRLAAFILCLVTVLPMLSLRTKAELTPPQTTAKSLILVDYSGNVIYENNAHEKLPPASVTKVMTMLLVMDAIADGKIKYEDMVSVSEHASSMGGSQVYLEPGERMSVRDLLKCVAVSSANDAAVALAEYVAGSEESFASMMNEKAAALGMDDTHFVNCCGLDVDGHLTCAADIAKMSVALLKHKDITNFTTIWMDTIRDGQFGLANTNRMLKSFSGATGLKTGFTSKAMYCLSASAERDGMGLICVLMGCPTSKERFADAAAMLNFGFANYTNFEMKTDDVIPTVPVTLGEINYVHGKVAQTGDKLLLERSKASRVEKKISMNESVAAPVAEGDKIGELIFTLDGQTIATADIVAAHSVARLTLGKIFGKIISNVFMQAGV